MYASQMYQNEKFQDSLTSILDGVRESYSNELPDFRTAMRDYLKLDIYQNLPEEAMDGPVKYLAEQRGYSRRTVQRAEEEDSGLQQMIKAADITSGSENTEKPELYEKYDYMQEQLQNMPYTQEFAANLQNKTQDYLFNGLAEDKYLQSIDSRINVDITPDRAKELKKEHVNNLCKGLENTVYDDFVRQMPYEAQLLYDANDAILGSENYSEGKKKFEASYFGLLADKYEGDLEKITETAGQHRRTVEQKLEKLGIDLEKYKPHKPEQENQDPCEMPWDVSYATVGSEPETPGFEFPEKFKLV